MMREVVETGSDMRGTQKRSDPIVVPFTNNCGECDQCKPISMLQVEDSDSR
jgi:threonine dehydrogenase-like Zn-dependent dehydrogenase